MPGDVAPKITKIKPMLTKTLTKKNVFDMFFFSKKIVF